MARRLYGLAPHRAEPVSTAPVPPSLKSKPTQRSAEFARMTVAAPTAPQRCLQGRERQDSDVTPLPGPGTALIVVGLDEPAPTLAGVDYGFSFLLEPFGGSIGSNPTGWPS